MSTIRLFATAPGQPKLPGYCPSSLQGALFGKIADYGADPRADGVTPTEISLAIATTVSDANIPKYCKLLAVSHADKAARDKQKELVMGLFGRLKSVARGTIEDDAVNAAFKAKFTAWSTTEEGKRLAKSVVQFAPETVESAAADIDDPFLAGLMQADAAGRRAARSSGQQAASSARQTLRGVRQTLEGNKSKLADQLRAQLSAELGDE